MPTTLPAPHPDLVGDSRKQPIGIFDSGIGGLTVAAEIFKKLPHEPVIYFGDTGRYPYGMRSAEVIQKFSRQDANFLLTFGVKLIVVACNTASALALEKIKGEYRVPLVGVIEPGARAAVQATRTGRVGVIGTVGTINSDSYARAIRRIDPAVKVFSLPCPLFVPLAEEGFLDKPATRLIAREYLAPLKKKDIDALVLGCTHYPLLKKVISHVMGKQVRLIDSASETAGAVKAELEVMGLSASDGKQSGRQFFVSDTPEKFVQIGRRFLRKHITRAEKIDITQY